MIKMKYGGVPGLLSVLVLTACSASHSLERSLEVIEAEPRVKLENRGSPSGTKAETGRPTQTAAAEAEIEPTLDSFKVASPPLVTQTVPVNLPTAGRVAFVVGNSDYREIGELENPVNDATDVAAKLQTLGFELHGGKAHLNLTQDELLDQFNRFTKLANSKQIALFYFAGHGLQFNGVPHLLPVDVRDADWNIVKSRSISMDHLLEELDGHAELTVAIFDACREIPELKRRFASAKRGSSGSSRGLSRPSVEGTSTLVVYSGGAGELVADGHGRNSPYTGILLNHLNPQLIAANSWDVPGIFEEVAFQFRQTHGGQRPELINQGVRPNSFYLATANP